MLFRSLVAAAAAASAYAAVDADLVPSLPGYGPPPSKVYSGYLTTGSQTGAGTKHSHYIFIESMTNPASAPVVSWYNGGPGCSSLEGLFAENGILFVNETDPSTLYLNPNSWSNVANMLYIEHPSCVGYSYADEIAGCTHNDTSQAIDNWGNLQSFFTSYPEYQSNPYFITGESYAGIYVPTLAQQVVLNNAAGNGIKINLQGIAVGNGCLGLTAGQCSFDYGVEINTNVPYFRGHSLISGSLYKEFATNCPVGTDPTNPSASCVNDINAAHAEVGNVNIYNIYGDCITGPNTRISDGVIDVATGRRVFSRAPVPVPASRLVNGPVECIDETISVYIGSAVVANALHVIPTLNFAVCGSNSSFNYVRTLDDERVSVYPDIVNAGVRVWIYNGESDACVPNLDNEAWTASMNYTLKKGWTAWSSNNQVGGYVIQYDNNLTYLTVKGAGHMVPQNQPETALHMFTSFITNTPLA